MMRQNIYIPSEIKDILKKRKYYEFKYTLKGKGIINSIDELNMYLISSLYNKYNGNEQSGTIYVNLEIKETNKTGISQIQENICQ